MQRPRSPVSIFAVSRPQGRVELGVIGQKNSGRHAIVAKQERRILAFMRACLGTSLLRQ